MTGTRLGLLVAPLAAALVGCGGGGRTQPVPALARLPLADGTAVVARAQQCDAGTNAYCAIELVVVGTRYRSSGELVAMQARRLRQRGWTGASGDTGDERAADSPGHALRITYATASGDLRGIVFGWIKRPRGIALALSRTLFDRAPAMSIMLEVGAS